MCPFSVIWEIITPKEREEYAFLPHRESDSSAGKSLGMEKAESRPGGLQVKCISLHDLRPLPRMEAMIFSLRNKVVPRNRSVLCRMDVFCFLGQPQWIFFVERENRALHQKPLPNETACASVCLIKEVHMKSLLDSITLDHSGAIIGVIIALMVLRLIVTLILHKSYLDERIIRIINLIVSILFFAVAFALIIIAVDNVPRQVFR